MKSIFEQVIRRGEYDLASLLKNIDRYHIEGKLSNDDRDELYAYARQDAVPQYDMANEVERLWAAIREINAQLAEGHIQPQEPADVWPEYVQPTGAHDAYQVGDKITYHDKRYTCAMAGCVWAPDVYPAAWTEMEE